MKPRTAANIALFALAAFLLALMVYGFVALYNVANVVNAPFSTAHKLGVTILSLVISVLLLGALAKMLFHGLGTNLTDHDIDTISDSLSLFHDIKLALAGPDISYTDFERSLLRLCERLDRIYHFPPEKIRKLDGLRQLIVVNYPTFVDYLDLGLARVGPSFDWIPQSTDKWLATIATNRDLAVLCEIALDLKRLGHPRAGVAKLKYLLEVNEQLNPSWNADYYIKMSETSKLPRWKPDSKAPDASLNPGLQEIEQLEIFAKQGRQLSMIG